MSKRKYERAWDLIDGCWKTPEEVDYAIMRDKPRFVSDKPNNYGDGGYILYFVRSTKKKRTRRAHFKKLRNNSLNIYENRQKIIVQETRRESDVHKLCKDLFKNELIDSIHVHKRLIPIVIGDKTCYLEVVEQDIKIIEVESIEKKDVVSSSVPDIIVKASINGMIQRFFIEIFYKHPVDPQKKYRYTSNKINCLEIDVGDIYEELKEDSTQDEIKNALINRIKDNANWISCNIEEVIKDGIHKHFNILNIRSNLRKSKLDTIDYFNRLYMFEDELRLSGTNRFQGTIHNIGRCNKCEHCLGIKGYLSDNLDDLEVTCSIEDVPVGIDKIQYIKNIIKMYIAEHAENIA